MGIPVMVTLDATAGGLFSVLGRANSEMMALATSGEMTGARIGKVGTTMAVGFGVGAAIIADKSIQMAADFETAMTQLETHANQGAETLKPLGDGFKELATQVGFTATELANADYHIASSGFNDVADNLNIMKAAAEGAKAGGADLDTTAQALSRTMVAFHEPASNAVQVMDALTKSTSLGDVRLEDMAQAMTNVLPAAASAGIGLDQVLGAMSLMTAQGENAASAGTHLRATILNLSGGTDEAARTMAEYGISVDQVRGELSGGGGLTGALGLLEDAVGKNTTGFTDYIAKLQDAGGDQAKFDDLIANMPDNLKSPIGALEKMTGGVRSFQAVLELTGKNADEFKSDVSQIGAALNDTNPEVEGFGAYSQTTNAQLARLKGTASDLGINIGTVLLPAVSSIASGLNSILGPIASSDAGAKALSITLGVLMVGGLVAATAKMAAFVGGGLMPIISGIGWLGGALGGVIANIARFAYAWGTIALESTISGITRLTAALRAGGLTSALGDATAATRTFLATEAVAGISIGALAGIILGVVAAAALLFYGFTRVRDITGSVGAGIAWVAGAVMSAVPGFQILGSVVTQAAIHFQELQAIVQVAAATIPTILSVAWSRVVAEAEAAWNALVSEVESQIASLISAVTAGMSQVPSAITSPLHAALGAAMGIAGQFVSVGVAIGEGMVSGILSVAGRIASAAANVVRGALNAARAAASILSPSRVFADEVGAYISLGIAAGITEQGPSVNSAVRAVVNPGNMGLFRGDIGTTYAPVSRQLGINGAADISAGGHTYHLEVHGNIFGVGGMAEAARQLWQEFLKMQSRSSLGFSISGG